MLMSFFVSVIKKFLFLHNPPQPALTTAGFDAFVRPIRTVFISVTLPTLGDTHV